MDVWQLAQLLVSAAIFSFIWFVQLVHYPFFQFVAQQDFSQAMLEHQRRISYLAMPLMLAELAITSYQVFMQQREVVLLLLVAIVWASTALLQVPRHRQLERGKDLSVIRSLVATNWIRTVAWSLKFALILRASWPS